MQKLEFHSQRQSDFFSFNEVVGLFLSCGIVHSSLFSLTTIFILSIRSPIHPLTHSFTSSPFIPSVSQSVSQLASQSVSQSVSQQVSRFVCLSKRTSQRRSLFIPVNTHPQYQ